MASIEKYTDNAVLYELRHNTRENPHPPKNIDIDPARTKYNYYLSPEDRGRCARESKDYYNARLREIYRYKRADVKTVCQWVVTAPKDLPPEQEKEFFLESYNYLNSLYGENNCIQCIVHFDEGIKDKDGTVITGRPHMHYMFIPAVENKKFMKPNKKGNITAAARYREKVCADELINKRHLSRFHPDFQKWLREKGIRCTVHSGVTGGKNRTVEELKAQTRAVLKEQEKTASLERENTSLRERIRSLEEQLSKEQNKSYAKPSGWGKTAGWGKEKSASWQKEM